MFTIPVETLLKMTTIEPHEELQAGLRLCVEGFAAARVEAGIVKISWRPRTHKPTRPQKNRKHSPKFSKRDHTILVTQAQGSLVVFERCMGNAAFVSHQWPGYT